MQNRQKYEVVPIKYEEINHIKLDCSSTLVSLDPSQTILIIALYKGYSKFYFFKSGEHKLIAYFRKVDQLKLLYYFQQSKIYSTLNLGNKYSISTLNSINKNKILISQQFEKHIDVIIYNKFEDLMVIGFKKGKLQLKKKDLLQWHTIQEIQLTSQIRDIHLNLEENQIVVEVQPKIIIIEKKNQRNEETWVVVQEINIDESFRNVIFVNDKTFAVKLCNIRKWMLFQQKNQCQFAHKRNIIIYGANEDLLYILEKYHEGQIRNPDKSNCFLNLEFQIDGTYLSLKDKQQYIQQFYPSGLQNDNYIQGEYFFGQDFRENQIIVGKYKQLFIEYKIVKSITFPQNEHYQIMTIKSDNQILVLGFNNQIKVFKLEDSTVTLIQVLNHHTDNVDSLLFQKTENSFIELLIHIFENQKILDFHNFEYCDKQTNPVAKICLEQMQVEIMKKQRTKFQNIMSVSGSSDKSIKIWSWDQVGKIYQCQQILQSLVKPYFIILNIQENLLVSGGQNLIQLWELKKYYWQLKQSFYFDSNSIFGLKFSPSQQTIATYTSNNKIILIKKKQQINWFISIEINVNSFTPSISFISDQIILYQSINEMSIRLIKLNQNQDEIQHQSKIMINQLCDEQTAFQMQYNKLKGILINQTKSVLNLIIITHDIQIFLISKIQFNSNLILGQLSPDGEFLATLDQESKEFQLRQYHCS